MLDHGENKCEKIGERGHLSIARLQKNKKYFEGFAILIQNEGLRKKEMEIQIKLEGIYDELKDNFK